MANSRAAIGLQWVLIGLILQLAVSLLAPGPRYADYITMGIMGPFQLSFFLVPAVGVGIGALYLAGFHSIYLERSALGPAPMRWVRLARWPLVFAAMGAAGTVAIAFATRFDFSIHFEYWWARAALDTVLAASAGVAFLLTFYDTAGLQGRSVGLLATLLGATGGVLRYGPNLLQTEASIYGWALETLSLGLFLLLTFKLRGEMSTVSASAPEVIASPPARH